jgi:dCMP deaminase
MKRALVLYVPVLHAGYIQLFRKHAKNMESLYILGPDFIKELMPLHEEIRALPPSVIKKMTEALNIFPMIKVLDKNSLAELKPLALVSADEEISRKFFKKYFPRKKVILERVFLRWDESSVQTTKPVKKMGRGAGRAEKKIMDQLDELSHSSPDWWRQVGAAIGKDGKILLQGYNKHVPSEHTPYINGDPRDFIAAGKNPGLATALHAEQALIAEAARLGIALKDASIYVTAFPCPVCAKLIAYSGIKKCFFRRGSATLDGEQILKGNSVKIIRVK